MDGLIADWMSYGKDVAAIAMAMLLLWRFERMTRDRSQCEANSRDAFLTSLQQQRIDFSASIRDQRADYHGEITAHMHENTEVLERVAQAMNNLCQQQAAISTIIQKCVKGEL